MKRIMPFLLLLFVTFSCSNSMLDSTDISIGVDLSELNLNYTSLDNLENNSKFKVSLYEVEKPEQVPVDYKSVDKSLYKMLASSYSSINDTKQASVVLNDIPVGINAFIIAEVFENDVDSSNVLYAGISKVFEVLPEKNIVDLELESCVIDEPVIQNFTLKFILSNQTENEITDIESGSSINIADKLKLDGYNVKFYEDANYSKQIYNTEIVINSDVTIYVELEAITYFIEYKLNDGIWAGGFDYEKSYTIESAVDFRLPTSDKIIRQGYTFEGWYKDADYAEKITSLVGLFEDITLYAKWEVINYSIEYKLNEGTWADTFIPIESYTIESAADLKLPSSDKIIREGYVFEGWYDNSEYTYAIDSLVGRTGNLTLYAKWRDENQVATVKFSPATDSVDMDTEITLTCETDGATIYYTTDGSDPKTSTNRKTYSENATICIKAGTTIKAYATKANSEMIDSDVATITYTLNVYTLNFDATGGTLPDGMQYSVPVTSGDTYKILGDDPTKTGYKFKGWYLSTNPDATENPIAEYTPNIENTSNKTVTFYAKWEPITYTVVFDGNSTDASSMDPQEFKYDESKALNQNTIVRTGYTFTGWNTNADGTGTPYADKAVVSNLTSADGEKITLYAQWKENKASITVTLPEYNEVNNLFSVTKNSDSQVTFTPINGYEHYIWYVNGTDKITNASNYDFTISSASYSGGVHTVMLVVEDSNGNYYSQEEIVEITK